MSGTGAQLLAQLEAALSSRSADMSGGWEVPRFLLAEVDCDPRTTRVEHPADLLLSKVVSLRHQIPPERPPAQSRLILELDIRTVCSLGGQVGSAVKAIAFLPFWREALGVTDIIVLPTGEIGRARRKGTDGSLFAVANPFGIAEWLADPLVPAMSPLDQYRAFVAAASMLGVSVGSIVPLATLAVDSPLFRYAPEMGYWWAQPPDLLLTVNDVSSWVVPPAGGQPIPGAMAAGTAQAFSAPPVRSSVSRESGTDQAWRGESEGGTLVHLCNAFPDIGGETGPYAWQDVSGVNFSGARVPWAAGSEERAEHTASDRVRVLVGAALAWRAVVLDERIAWVDLTPAVPADVFDEARRLHDLWQDDWGLQLERLGRGRLTLSEADRLIESMRSARPSRRLLVDAGRVPFVELMGEELWSFEAIGSDIRMVTGPLPYCVGAHTHDVTEMVSSLRHHLNQLQRLSQGRTYLAMVSNHDTRPVDPSVGLVLFEFLQGLPGSVPAILAGFEWGSTVPTNKEFGYHGNRPSDAELTLFSTGLFEWADLGGERGVEATAHLEAVCQALHGRVSSLRSWPGYRAYEHEGVTAPIAGYERWIESFDERVMVVANFSTRPEWVPLGQEGENWDPLTRDIRVRSVEGVWVGGIPPLSVSVLARRSSVNGRIPVK